MEGETLCDWLKTRLLFFLLQLVFLCRKRLNCGDYIKPDVVSMSFRYRCGHLNTMRFMCTKAVRRLMAPGESSVSRANLWQQDVLCVRMQQVLFYYWVHIT